MQSICSILIQNLRFDTRFIQILNMKTVQNAVYWECSNRISNIHHRSTSKSNAYELRIIFPVHACLALDS